MEKHGCPQQFALPWSTECRSILDIPFCRHIWAYLLFMCIWATLTGVLSVLVVSSITKGLQRGSQWYISRLPHIQVSQPHESASKVLSCCWTAVMRMSSVNVCQSSRSHVRPPMPDKSAAFGNSELGSHTRFGNALAMLAEQNERNNPMHLSPCHLLRRNWALA